jgi:uncharacterized protein YodC (DUF2158 family)
MFKPGDMVIKTTGGNKMRVTETSCGMVTCIWATDTIHTDTFPEVDLMTVDTYEIRSAQQSGRNDKINQLL